MNKPNASSSNPSAKAHEAAATISLADLVKNREKQPSPQAFGILAKLAAAKRERLKVESAKMS